MSQENVTKFFKAVETDTDLREKVAARLKEEKCDDEEKAMKKMIKIASENGYIFNVDDMKSATHAVNDCELGDEELENVVGGLVGLVVWDYDTGKGQDSKMCIMVGWVM